MFFKFFFCEYIYSPLPTVTTDSDALSAEAASDLSAPAAEWLFEVPSAAEAALLRQPTDLLPAATSSGALAADAALWPLTHALAGRTLVHVLGQESKDVGQVVTVCPDATGWV